VEAAALGHSSDDMPERDLVVDLAAADRFLRGDLGMLDVARALHNAGLDKAASNILEMGRQRVAGDYLQPSAIFDRDGRVLSAINDPNDYAGPGTGYRMTGERWQEVHEIPQAKSPRAFVAPHTGEPSSKLVEIGDAKPGTRPEVIVAVGPGWNTALTRTIGGLSHEDVLAAILSGVAAEGLTARIVKVYASSDCAAIGHTGAQLSGSGVAIGIQSRGTAVIHQRDLARLNNLELFPQSPALTLETYREIGRNAARYAQNRSAKPVAVRVDNWARLRLIVKTALLHRAETEQVAGKPPQEVFFDWEPEG
jgi:propanediol dehydratase large subunit